MIFYTFNKNPQKFNHNKIGKEKLIKKTCIPIDGDIDEKLLGESRESSLLKLIDVSIYTELTWWSVIAPVWNINWESILFDQQYLPLHNLMILWLLGASPLLL